MKANEPKPTKEQILLSHIGKAYNNKSVFHQRYLDAMQGWADIQNKELLEYTRRLEFMIENGLGWEDMIIDVTLPHEI